MSPFGLFDLLKTLLPSPDQTAQNPSTMDNKTETDGATMSSPTPPPDAQTPPPPDTEKSNACADFLYRHERRAQGVKATKKRLD